MQRIFMLLLLPLFLFGGIKIVTVTTSAYGSSQSAAIENALTRAIEQVSGLSIQSARSIVRSSLKGKILVNHNGAHSKSVVKVATKQQAAAIATQSKGAIQSYEVLSLHPTQQGYYAKLRVHVAKYISPGLNPRNRRAIAVMPFEYKPTYTIFGIPIDGKALSDRITQAVVSKITQTRKFTVLDRQNSRYYQLEKRFLLSGDSDPIELARLGRRLGTDYIIIGQIIDFAVDTEAGNSLIGASDASNVAQATISYRILNIPTQQIKWSNTFNVDIEPPTTNRAERLIATIADAIAQKLVDEIMFNIYPPKIIRVNGKSVVINMGGNVIHQGDRFEVFALGQKLYDPYTKEYLGRDEKKIGEIEVTKVLPKISYATITSGKAKKGAIIRPLATQESEDSQGKDSMFDAMFPAQ